MGVYYHAQSIIGVEIDHRCLITEITVRAFKHNHPQTMKYDPKTGKPLWRVETNTIKEFNEDKKTLHTPHGDFKVVIDGYDEHMDRVFVGFVFAGNTDSNGGPTVDFAPLPVNIEELKDNLRKGLQAVLGDVWHPNKFGVYAILKIS